MAGLGAETVHRNARLGRAALAAGLVTVFVAVGALGVYRYARGFWLYRGFPPPNDPAFVSSKGVAERIYVASAALGRSQPVDVYLPPGYSSTASSHRRYPVFYLLHGFPGRPGAFLETVRMGVVEDVLVARHRIRPVILVMPFGSTGTFTDKEWVDGVRPHEGWATFVSRDLVRAVDSRFRTIPTGTARAIGGLSEGGYGAIDIALHHPREFRVVESWSGYEQADPIRSIFGRDRARLAANSPLLQIGRAAPALRAARTRFWFYSGSDDRLLTQNRRFAAELQRLHLPYRFFVRRGGHNWALWRGNAAVALLAAARHLA
jgi:enterochelin esterase-like enzyme